MVYGAAEKCCEESLNSVRQKRRYGRLRVERSVVVSNDVNGGLTHRKCTRLYVGILCAFSRDSKGEFLVLTDGNSDVDSRG